MAKAAKKEKVDLLQGIHFRVAGEAGKTNGLSWTILSRMGNHLHQLLKLLAKYNIASNFEPNLQDFEIELFDFREGSAVPAFRFRPLYALSLDDEVNQQRKDVSEALNKLLFYANTGKYEKIKSDYEEPEITSEIASELFNFTHSAGNSPISVVKPLRGAKKYRTIYSIKRPKRAQVMSLITERKKAKQTLENEEVYARVLEKGMPGGKKYRKIKELYRGRDNHMAFTPAHIVAPNKTYYLHSPMMCIIENEEDYYVIQADLYDLYAAGPTLKTAEQNFYEEFDHAYQHLMDIEDSRLSDRLQRAKAAFKLIVKEIVDEATGSTQD